MSKSQRVAFEEVYSSSYPVLLAVAIATVGDRAVAEDAVQDAFSQAWAHWSEIANPRGWLRRVVVRRCLEQARTSTRRLLILRRYSGQFAHTPTSGDERDFLDLLDGLSPRQRVALTLRYVENLSEMEIADVMGCRPGTVKSTLSRARDALRARIEGAPA